MIDDGMHHKHAGKHKTMDSYYGKSNYFHATVSASIISIQ